MGSVAGITLCLLIGVTVGLCTAAAWTMLSLPVRAMDMLGAFTGMLASALAEVLEVYPQFLHRAHMHDQVKTVAWALALGKMAGGFLATVWPIA